MKKIQVMLNIGLLFSLLFATANVFANTQPGTAQLAKPAQVEASLSEEQGTFKGAVTAAGNGSLTLSLKNGGPITFVVTSATKVKVPALSSGATLADVKKGMQATVQAVQTNGEDKEDNEGEDGEDKGAWMALSIDVVPGTPEKVHRAGVVTDYVAGVKITILVKDGNSYPFVIAPDTKIIRWRRANLLGVGARVTIDALRDGASTEWTAQRIVIVSNATSTGTKTPLPPTATNTLIPPGMTNTPVAATATKTSLPPTATASATSVPATATNTSLPPTATNTPVPPTATNTSLPPTATKTSVPPTATNTALPPTATTAPITWVGDVGPLLAMKCTMCHGSSAGVTLNTYQDAMRTGSIIPGNAAGSKLVQVQQKGGHFGQLSASELAKVIAWIQAGAPEK